MSRSNTLDRAAGLPPLLIQIIKAAIAAEQLDPGNDREGHADALVAFGQLAATAVPTRGVLAPVDDILYSAFESIAVAHLGLRQVKDELRAALHVVANFADRDPIESAVNHFRTVTEAAYFYGGLAFAITFVSPGWAESAQSTQPVETKPQRAVRGRTHRPRRRR